MSVWYAGLDLGKVRDPSCFAVLEESPRGSRGRLYVTLLRTWRPERDDCLDVLPVVAGLVRRDRPAEVHLAIDGRGIGRDVAELAMAGTVLPAEVLVYPLLPSSSPRSHRQREDGMIWVGKRHLFGAVIDAFERGTLDVAPGLAEGEALVRELEGLRAVPTKGGESWTYSHPDQRKASHDDRVAAVADALFLARYARPETPAVERIRPANRATSGLRRFV